MKHRTHALSRLSLSLVAAVLVAICSYAFALPPPVEIGLVPGAADTLLYSTGTASGWRTTSAQLDAGLGATQGQVLYRGAAAWAVLAPGTAGQALTTGGAAANPSWAAPAPSAHNLLSASHGDTAAASPVRGDLLVGNATPAWTKLAAGAAGTVLVGGTDPSYSATPSLTSLTLTTALARAEGGTGTDVATTDGQLLIGNTATGNWSVATLTATANQTTVTNGGGTVTLGTVQAIGIASSPQFAAVNVGGTDVGLTRTAAGVARVSNGSTGMGALNWARVQATKTAAYTIVANDGGTVFDNQGTLAEVNLTLPVPVAGMEFVGCVKDVDGLKFTAGAGVTIRIAGSVSAAAGNVVSTTIGSTITLTALSTTEWYATSALGTWTVN